MKYSVGCHYDCTNWTDVEASSPEEALELAYARAPAGICHQCSSKFDIGDIIDTTILDENGEEVEA